MSGREAAQQLLDEAAREEFLSVELLVRALRSDRRTVLKDWTKRNNPITRVGRRTLLQSSLVVRTYFPHAFPVSSEHLAASTGVTEEIQR